MLERVKRAPIIPRKSCILHVVSNPTEDVLCGHHRFRLFEFLCDTGEFGGISLDVFLRSKKTLEVVLVAGLVSTLAMYSKARRAEKKATDSLTEILRLSDIKRLKDYTQKADDLVPSVPEKVPEMETWLKDA